MSEEKLELLQIRHDNFQIVNLVIIVNCVKSVNCVNSVNIVDIVNIIKRIKIFNISQADLIQSFVLKLRILSFS